MCLTAGRLLVAKSVAHHQQHSSAVQSESDPTLLFFLAVRIIEYRHGPRIEENRGDSLNPRYFTSAALFAAKSSTHDGKMPRNSVPTAGRISATRKAGVSGSTGPAASAGSRMYITTSSRR